MQVRKLADLAGTTVRTVRYYHQIGLLPVPPSPGGRRDYDFTHLARLLRIRWLVVSGMPLRSVGELLDAEHDGQTYDATGDLQSTINAIDEKLEQLRHQRSRLGTMLRRARDGRRISPLSDNLIAMYDDMLTRTVDPLVRQTIIDDREVAELAAFSGALPAELEDILTTLDDDAVSRALQLLADFAHLPEAPADDLPAVVDDLVTRTAMLMDRLGHPWKEVARAAWQDDPTLYGFVPEQFSHPHQRAYLDAVMDLLQTTHSDPTGDPDAD